MNVNWQCIQHLKFKGQSHLDRVSQRTDCQQAIVVAPAVPEPGTGAIKDHAGNNHQVNRILSCLAGRLRL